MRSANYVCCAPVLTSMRKSEGCSHVSTLHLSTPAMQLARSGVELARARCLESTRTSTVDQPTYGQVAFQGHVLLLRIPRYSEQLHMQVVLQVAKELYRRMEFACWTRQPVQCLRTRSWSADQESGKQQNKPGRGLS